MPNWCMNSVMISGTQEQLEAIEKAANEERLLEFLAPLGEWDYHKAINTWGVKWDVCEVSCYIDDGHIQLNFNTAWGPPIDAYNTAEQTLGLAIDGSYYEPGMCFVGDRDGSYNIDFSQTDWAKDIPIELIEEWDLEYEYEQFLEWYEPEEEG